MHSASYSRRTADSDLRQDLGYYDQHCRALDDHLRRMGITADVDAWRGPGSAYAWMQDMLSAPEEIARLIPAGGVFILVDEDQLGTEFVAGRLALPFPERNGLYAGIPASAEEAIREVERLREGGAQFIVFVSSTFWWLDHFSGLSRHLRSRYRCVHDTRAVVVFDLNGGTDA